MTRSRPEGRLFPGFSLSAVVLILLIPLSTGASGQIPADDVRNGPKVGLVLSGGGAKGIAHIGVLKVLEEAGIRVDVITGTSIGSIVGALYSIGYTPDEMLDLVASTDWNDLFTDRPSHRLLSMYEKEANERSFLSFPISDRGLRLPRGMVGGQYIFNWLARHTWPALEIEEFSRLPIPFATVATDLETGEAVAFHSGYLPDAIRASISFPSMLTPHRVDDHTLLDGGLVRNLPVREAIDLGAEYIIAVDVTSRLHPAEELQSITSILNQAIHYRMIEKLNEQKELADLVIEVDGLNRFGITDFEYAGELAEAGERSAGELKDRLEAIAARQRESAAPERGPGLTRDATVPVRRISVTGHQYVSEEVILRELELLAGRNIGHDEIETVIHQLYSSRLFQLITYRLFREDEGYHLQFRVVENIDDTFRAGARYESESQASVYMHATFRNLVQRSSILRTKLRLGRESEFLTDYLIYGTGTSLGLNTRIGYRREEIDYFEGGDRLSSLTEQRVRADLFAGSFLNPTYLLGIGIRRDFVRYTRQVNPDLIPFSNTDHHAVYGRLMLETLNRRSWPTRGHKLFLQTTISDSFFGSPLSFNEQRFYWQYWQPLSPSLSLQNTIYIGRSEGDEIPWDYWHSPNRIDPDLGMIRFGGFSRYELAGPNIQMVSAGLQLEFMRHRFLRADVYLGNTFETWNWNIDENRYRTGISLAAGALTVLGPIELILSASSRNAFLWELQIGYEF